jgi:hypothetical protein
MYRPHLAEEERPEEWPIDITGSWAAVTAGAPGREPTRPDPSSESDAG